MTARVSASLPSGPHMWPEVRIIAGIEASTITSLGTCRLVMPLSESTIASARAVGEALLDGGLDGLALVVGQRLRRVLSRAPRPSFGLTPGGGERVAVLGEQRREERAHRRGRR